MDPYLTREDFDKHLLSIKRANKLTVDTEGTLTHPFSKTWGLSSSANGVNEYFAFNHILPGNLSYEWLPELADAVENAPCLIMHNAKHDLKAMRNLGIDYKGPFYDTMLMAHMINENLMSKELDYLSKYYGGEPKRNSDVMKSIIKGFGWEYIPVDLMRTYGANDAYITEELFYALYDDFMLQGFNDELWQIEQDFCRLLMKIEDYGILVDQDLSASEYERGTGIMRELEKELGFNPGSPQQLGKFLLEDLGLPVVARTKTGNPSFDKKAMEEYDFILQNRNDKRARMVLTYRGWQKTTSSNYRSYLEKLGPDGRIRTNYKQHGTKTGRLSSSDPNLQQIPRESPNDWNGKLKKAFITKQGRRRYEFDYAQLELRVGAAYGQDSRMLAILNDPNRDFFTETGRAIGLTRQDTKTFNYTIQFGGTARRIHSVFNIDFREANNLIRSYYQQYPGLLKISKLSELRASENGYVSYWTGRRRHFQYQEEWRKAFNSVCQGGGFEIIKRKAVEIDKAGLNNEECAMDLTVHDSLCFDIEEGKEREYLPEIKRIMEDVRGFGVSFPVGCKEWATDHDLDMEKL